MPFPIARRWRWLAAAALLALTGCQPPPPVDERVVVLGFDGLDPTLTRRWMAAGLLPNFKRLAQQGHFQPLATTNPAQSPVAWASFATGEPPGHHGIFDFLKRDSEHYRPEYAVAWLEPPADTLELFDYTLPLSDPTFVNGRQGTPFWLEAEADGHPSSILRVPVTFPPDPVQRMLAGMGVPDLLGTQGTYTFITTARTRGGENSRVQRIPPLARVDTVFEGPPHPLKPDAEPLDVPLRVERLGTAAVRVTLDGTTVTLKPGDWSDWVPLAFGYGPLLSIDGMVRLHLVATEPHLELYVSPIQVDPRAPALPITAPAGFAPELAERIGLYHTLGMPEETWSLNDRRISDAAYLQMVTDVLAEREAMFFDTLQRHDSDLVVGVFVQTDRVSHMFWRGLDAGHPLHAEAGPEARRAVQWIYREADRILGRTLEELGPDDRLLVLSDHGFTSFRRSLHLNRWLAEHGYLGLGPGRRESGPVFEAVDWDATRAYALGFNGVFLNLAGREGAGIVDPAEATALKARLRRELAALTDPESAQPMVEAVYDGADLYPGAAPGAAPDLVIGYAPGYRASWQTALGAVPKALVEDNREKWSGDHLIEPSRVPGVLFTNFDPEEPVGHISEVAGLIKSALAR